MTDHQGACRFCNHAVQYHNLQQGCEVCSCMGSPSEVAPRNDSEWNQPVLSNDTVIAPYIPRRKDADVKHALAAIEDDIEVLEVRLAALKAQRERLSTPPEPADGSVVKFTVQFNGREDVYRYSAYRIGPYWYTSSGQRNRQIMDWKTLIEFMRSDYSVKTGAAELAYALATPSEFRMVKP